MEEQKGRPRATRKQAELLPYQYKDKLRGPPPVLLVRSGLTPTTKRQTQPQTEGRHTEEDVLLRPSKADGDNGRGGDGPDQTKARKEN